MLTDAKTKTYYLYGAEHYLGEACDETGVWVRKSADLKNWSAPRRVMTAPKGIQCVWAPEVHEYKGAYIRKRRGTGPNSILAGLEPGDGAVKIPKDTHLALPIPAALVDREGHP